MARRGLGGEIAVIGGSTEGHSPSRVLRTSTLLPPLTSRNGLGAVFRLLISVHRSVKTWLQLHRRTERLREHGVHLSGCAGCANLNVDVMHADTGKPRAIEDNRNVAFASRTIVSVNM